MNKKTLILILVALSATSNVSAAMESLKNGGKALLTPWKGLPDDMSIAKVTTGTKLACSALAPIFGYLAYDKIQEIKANKGDKTLVEYIANTENIKETAPLIGYIFGAAFGIIHAGSTSFSLAKKGYDKLPFGKAREVKANGVEEVKANGAEEVKTDAKTPVNLQNAEGDQLRKPKE